jgi:2-polyprenyl-3-methyl-5-hydroxy-6-metoxy-1,4-benzoquinol methylase
MFRFPKDSSQTNHAFYQREYQQGFTTDCPDDETLERLKQQRFLGSPKDYTTYLNVLSAAGGQPGQVVFDFGASWGYGSWQLAQAGYRVYSYEISQPRARYATEKLGCTMVDAPDEVPEKVDFFFSAHVIEHLPNPGILWDIAQRTIKDTGTIMLFMPNGEPRRSIPAKQYHQLWGQVHPLLLTANALMMMAQRYGFTGCAYSSPYDLGQIESRLPGTLDGNELLLLAWRPPALAQNHV